ncbi:MAG: site-specific integrase, partial [Deltaproteobacteria bacterium]|nr:site-specific integrase [Deltaproteobacteria bacterium]
LPLSKLTPFYIQSFYSAKVTAGRADGKEGGLKGASIRYLHIILHQALESSVDFGLLPANPTRKVKVPNPQDVEPEEIHPLDEDQVAQFLEAAKGSRFETLFIVALGTGLRRGELFGLKWEDIDLQDGLLTVKRTVHAVKGGLKFGPPKTKKSRRTISMPPVVVEALKKHRKEQKEEKLRLGPVYQEQGLVFPAEGGTPFHLDNIRRYFKPLLKRAGLPDIRFYDLRYPNLNKILTINKKAKVLPLSK